MSAPACGRWRGPTNSTASFPSLSSFRPRNMTPMCVRASGPSWRRPIRGACQPPTPPSQKGRSRGAPLSLSYRVPVIENHGLRVVNERTYQIVPSATPAPAPVWLHDMTIEANDGKPIEIRTEFNHRLEASIMAVVGDRAESDGYNALILRTALGWREISAIRALSRYLRQIRAPFSPDY